MTAPLPPERRARLLGRGFSLIELIVVVILIAILAAAAAPAVLRATEQRAASASIQLQRDLLHARQAALATAVPRWVVFSTAPHSYELFAENPQSLGKANRSAVIDPATGRSFSVALNTPDSPVTFTSLSFGSGSELGFDYLGRPINTSESLISSDALISLSSGAVIRVKAYSGQVLIE